MQRLNFTQFLFPHTFFGHCIEMEINYFPVTLLLQDLFNFRFLWSSDSSCYLKITEQYEKVKRIVILVMLERFVQSFFRFIILSQFWIVFGRLCVVKSDLKLACTVNFLHKRSRKSKKKEIKGPFYILQNWFTSQKRSKF